ncbi:unnamed protein product [Bursaphelenchus xylophilus]|uniref:(pine wood nematode) hypothetical protein n=1 Tax=Bursaphelenchus xylophilus TaxID=6326 RepID=A0A1I7S072_BURXY|nr:unnamed protein product [Bursaphelenchus xylophilus]CAG9108970.1 unnamed protein product [Bursaphelenchus xylophilus]
MDTESRSEYDDFVGESTILLTLSPRESEKSSKNQQSMIDSLADVRSVHASDLTNSRQSIVMGPSGFVSPNPIISGGVLVPGTLNPGEFGIYYHHALNTETGINATKIRPVLIYKTFFGSMIARPLEKTENGWIILGQNFTKICFPFIKSMISFLSHLGYSTPGNPHQFEHLPFWTFRGYNTLEECAEYKVEPKKMVPGNNIYIPY